MKKHGTNRVLALLLVFVMTLSLFPVGAVAEEEAAEPAVSEEIVETVVPEDDVAAAPEEPVLDASMEDEPAAADAKPDTAEEDDPTDLPGEDPAAALEDNLIPEEGDEPEVPSANEEIDALPTEDNGADEPDAEPPAAEDTPNGEEPLEEDPFEVLGSAQGAELLNAEGDDPAIIASGTCGANGDNLTWELTEDGTLAISGSGDMADFDYCASPWYAYREDIRDLAFQEGVTSIGDYAFAECSALTSVTLPNSVTRLGHRSFAFCCNLKEITLSENLVTIEFMALNDTALESVYIPASVSEIQSGAFWASSDLLRIDVAPENQTYKSVDGVVFSKDGMRLEQYPDGRQGAYTVPAGVTSVGDHAFYGSSGLTSVSFPATLTSIGNRAFESSGLTAIHLPGAVSAVGSRAFAGLEAPITVETSNPFFTAVDGVLYSKDMTELVAVTGALGGCFTIPNSVTRICEGACVFNFAITALTIPASVTAIEGDSFAGCRNLSTIRFLHNAEDPLTIDIWAFNAYDCPTEILVSNKDQINPAISGYDWAGSGRDVTFVSADTAPIFGTYGMMTYRLLNGEITIVLCDNSISGEAVIPATINGYPVTAIADRAFSGCNSITSLTLSDGLKQIGNEAFSYCYKLNRIQFTGNVPSIASDAFTGVTADAFYPAGADWQPEDLLDYGGTLTWKVTQLDTPVLVSAANDVGGVTVKWGSVIGAKKYRVFRKTGNGSWKAIADTAETSFTDTTAVSGTKYTYTVRCVTADGSAYASAYNKTGKSVTYVAAPVVTSLTSVNGGVQIKWSASKGAGKYRVFRRTETENWAKVGDATGTSYTDKTAAAGTTYYYTVRCMNSTGKAYMSAYDTDGWSVTYIAAPVLVSAANDVGGVTVKWNASNGAELYRVFRKTGSGSWKTIADTAETSYLDTTAASGTKYTYTVRCVSADGATYISGYNTTGKTVSYIAAPVVTSVSSVSGGVQIQWVKSTGAAKYRVFRRTETGSWTKLGDTTGTSYTDKTAVAGTTYYYTVRCMNSTAKAYTSAYDPIGTPGSRG